MTCWRPCELAVELGVGAQQARDVHGGIGGRAFGVVVGGDELHIAVERPGEGHEPVVVVGGVGAGEGSVGHAGAHGLEEFLPLGDELVGVVGGRAQSVAIEEIRLVGHLEGDELRPHGARDECGFLGGHLRRAEAEIEPVDERPSGQAVEKLAQVADGLLGDDAARRGLGAFVGAKRVLNGIGGDAVRLRV